MIADVLYLLAGLVILIAGGEFLVRGASNIALRLKVSPLVVGLTVVAFGTSSPELLVSLQSALEGHPDMTMGNVIGSNICNLALVLGITAIFSPINVNLDSIRIDWPMTMGSSFLLFVLVTEGYLVRHEGLIFVIILVAYIVFLIRRSRKDKAALEAAEAEFGLDSAEASHSSTKDWVKDVAFILIGIVGLTLGSDWFVFGAKHVFSDLFIALGAEADEVERIVGIVVLALGTSLPELVTSIVAALKKNTDLAIGNLMGSNIFNVLSILGITSIIKDIEVSSAIIGYDMIWMLAITLVVLPLMVFKRKLERWHGVVLLCIYFYYTYTILP